MQANNKNNSSKLLQPRHSSIATAPKAKQYQTAVKRAAKSITVRNRLPRTQQQLYEQRLTQR